MLSTTNLVQKFNFSSFSSGNIYKTLSIILTVALLAGVGTGYLLSSTSGKGKGSLSGVVPQGAPKSAQQDTRTFRDFADGKLAKKPDPKPGETYSEGTHLLIREGKTPVALTSSVVDLSQYEGKEVKVYGETQKALKEGWLMDVGKVEAK